MLRSLASAIGGALDTLYEPNAAIRQFLGSAINCLTIISFPFLASSSSCLLVFSCFSCLFLYFLSFLFRFSLACFFFPLSSFSPFVSLFAI